MVGIRTGARADAAPSEHGAVPEPVAGGAESAASVGTVQVAIDAPRHTDITGPLTYTTERACAPGTLVHVPLGRRRVVGIVWPPPAVPAPFERGGLRPLIAVVDA